jgi:hypothetical protein
MKPESMPEPPQPVAEAESLVGVASTDLFCRRWNFEVGEDAVYVCKDNHEKGHPCEHEKMTGQEVVELIETLRSIILKQNAKHTHR